MVLVKGSKVSSHTCSEISSRPITRPAWRARYSSSAYSFVVSGICFPPRAVVGGIARGEHEDGKAQTRLPQPPANLEAIRRGNHHVENGEIVGVDGGLIERVLAAGGQVHGVGLLAQPSGHEIGDSGIVFHQQNAHGRRSKSAL